MCNIQANDDEVEDMATSIDNASDLAAVVKLASIDRDCRDEVAPAQRAASAHVGDWPC